MTALKFGAKLQKNIQTQAIAVDYFSYLCSGIYPWAMKKTALFVFCIVTVCVSAQKKALFIGNSYTSVNDLPGMVASMAASTDDKIITYSNTPGGCRFIQHCQNQSMTMIREGGWDVVVLQEQSQYPAFPEWQVEAEVYPYAKRLVDSIYANNDCPEPMFYMTWGHKNGDAGNAKEYPPIGTYEGMDSLLRTRYIQMGKDNHASVCPVGKVWHYIRRKFNTIELYSNDESHPSMAGTYAAACAFYAMILEKDPTLIEYHSSLLDTATERIIRNVAKLVVYDSLEIWKREQPEASFSYTDNGNYSATFTAQTEGADGWEWSFGDGSTDDGKIVTHTFASDGTYNVQLVVSKHCLVDTVEIEVVINDSTTTESSVEVAEMEEDVNVRIVDMTGRLIYQGKREEAPYSSLPAGVYFVNRKKIVLTRK